MSFMSIQQQSIARLLQASIGTCSCRCIHVSSSLDKNVRTGKPKTTNNRSKPLTYEQAQQPNRIFVTKYWNSINTSGLHVEKKYERWLPRSSEVAVEDAFIRKFIIGTFQDTLFGEVIVKRRANIIYLAFIVRRYMNPSSQYFLRGYTEKMLSTILKSQVKLEIQTINDPRDLIFKKI
ncbi:small ribosomal subunit protein uS3m-like [Watersipora subatra]|uniref:small ribosomal subunit protein uS3m-like n=1 Tax=Watersipora subatra TaxID=2589382 RepID=UPI00355C1DDF